MSSDETGEEVFEPAPDEPSQVAELDTSRSAKVAKAWWLIEHQGMSFEAAAKELNVSKNTAWRMCKLPLFYVPGSSGIAHCVSPESRMVAGWDYMDSVRRATSPSRWPAVN